MTEEVKFVSSPDKHVRKAFSILELKEMALSDEAIAETLNLPSVEAVEEALVLGLSRAYRSDPNAVARTRELVNRRLERLLRAVMPKALNMEHPEQLAAHARALAVIDRHAKLYGLDAATKVDVEITPTQREMAEFVATVVKMRQDLPQEGDIFGVVEAEGFELEEGA